jgi:DnaJ homolog subfamily C member 13
MLLWHAQAVWCAWSQSGAVRRYTSTDREALLASLLDGVRASGNRDVCVKFSETGVFNRVGPWSQPVEEEIQVMYLKSLAAFEPAGAISFDQLVSRYGQAPSV